MQFEVALKLLKHLILKMKKFLLRVKDRGRLSTQLSGAHLQGDLPLVPSLVGTVVIPLLFSKAPENQNILPCFSIY